ncbi:Asp23/Gls24 family envelope stress response protein [Neochlamydia sp. EPS4]|uniref:Asp23/Gls24 family envelope stress response protein n=1 Tax=Neochlamydia sp. EPS4 TaxID=1478175 RepID=UPI0005D12478|nr:Asp23/Gls24 family envelope stress response protein [Neochlamydia sp. EPS4]
MPIDVKKVDTKEFELPETLFIRDVDNKVFQGIVLECLNRIEGVTLVESTFIDSIFGRNTTEGARGIIAEQDNKNHSVGIKIEVNVFYGISIPEKAEEIQTLVSEEITHLTGLHVSYVHVVFKNVVTADSKKSLSPVTHPVNLVSTQEDYSDEF